MPTKFCLRACRQGSVNLPVWRRLAQHAAAGRLTVLESWEVASAAPCAPSGCGSDNSADGCVPGSSCAWRLAVRRREDPSLPCKLAGSATLFQQAVAASAQATSGDGRREGADQQDAEQQKATAHEQQAQQRELAADCVWLACGSAYDAAADPVLRQLAAAAPTLLAGGFPLLDDEHLCWPGAAVYLAGRGALLAVGPCAGGWGGEGQQRGLSSGTMGGWVCTTQGTW